MLHKEYDRKGSVEKISGRESQGTWRQDELIGGKQPVVNELSLYLKYEILGLDLLLKH
jgi:hypothetical protein